MNVDFANRRIQKTCSSLQEMRREFGDRRAKMINTRLLQLSEAENLEALRHDPGDWHELTQNRQGQVAVSIGQPYRLIFIPTGDPPLKPDGGLDWSQITAVTIVEVVDYH